MKVIGKKKTSLQGKKVWVVSAQMQLWAAGFSPELRDLTLSIILICLWRDCLFVLFRNQVREVVYSSANGYNCPFLDTLISGEDLPVVVHQRCQQQAWTPASLKMKETAGKEGKVVSRLCWQRSHHSVSGQNVHRPTVHIQWCKEILQRLPSREQIITSVSKDLDALLEISDPSLSLLCWQGSSSLGLYTRAKWSHLVMFQSDLLVFFSEAFQHMMKALWVQEIVVPGKGAVG